MFQHGRKSEDHILKLLVPNNKHYKPPEGEIMCQESRSVRKKVNFIITISVIRKRTSSSGHFSQVNSWPRQYLEQWFSRSASQNCWGMPTIRSLHLISSKTSPVLLQAWQILLVAFEGTIQVLCMHSQGVLTDTRNTSNLPHLWNPAS